MTVPTDGHTTPRRAAMAKARQSRRPSRLGTGAGSTPQPDYVLAAEAGFPGVLTRAWQAATRAPSMPAAVETLLTLDGHIPADVSLRALRTTDEVALWVLFGRSWREGCTAPDRPAAEGPAADGPRYQPAGDGTHAYVGELGLTTSGRVVLRTPSAPPLATQETLVDAPLRMPWSAETVARFERAVRAVRRRQSAAVADCRQWLEGLAPGTVREMLARLQDAAQRTAPFILYQEDRQYTNFRDRNTLTGKTLWPGHPDCAVSSLQQLPPASWSDSDVVMVVCLTLLVRSGGYARIEEANGTQLSLDHVADLLERTRRTYQQACGRTYVPPAATTGVDDVETLATAVADRRAELRRRFRMYREIHGPLMHKIERIAGPLRQPGTRREAALCAHLRRALPFEGDTLAALAADLADDPDWLAQPHGGFGTGLESLVHAVVQAAVAAFSADFAMSRGIRSLPRLVQALRDEDWSEIVRWEIGEYFCCVVPSPAAQRHFPAGSGQLADISWAISSRMQYNSWHFIAGNLPRVPAVEARDFFVPPTAPDIAHYSDQHHRGHVAAKVRFTIRSPQPVEILGRPFDGFVDLRLLRCEGEPFDEQDLLVADCASRLVARATRLAADMVAAGEGIEVTAFDSEWHWRTIAGDDADDADDDGAGRADGVGGAR